MYDAVGDVDLRHHIAAADEGPGCVEPLHLEVRIQNVLVGRTKIVAPRTLPVFFFGTGKKKL